MSVSGHKAPGAAMRALEACLAAEARWNGHVNAVVTSMAQTARLEAAAADRAASEGRWLGLLHGMTIAIKDNIDTAGVETTAGSLHFKGRVPTRDAPVIERLRRAGAVVVSKVTMHELAFGIRSYNPVIGQARNPYDLARVPGGSSGGSGIAVATGMAAGALGTDTGGSVRIPAAMTGIAGLRPTHGRVPNTGSFPVSAQHDTIGPMAASVADCARIFAVIAGFDAEDPVSVKEPLPNFLPTLADGIRGVRIGIPTNHYLEGVAADIYRAYEAVLQVFERLGAELVHLPVEGAETAHAHATVMIYSDACALHAKRMAEAEKWGQMTLERLRTGLQFTGTDYARAMRARESWRRTLRRIFGAIDILASPTALADPPLIDDGQSLLKTTTAYTQTTYAGAFGGLPGLSIPCGVSSRGLPIGLQLEAAPWQEPLLLRAGHAFQEVTDWHRRRPELPRA